MSVKVMSMVWEYSQAKGGDLIILLAIADHADDDGRAFPGEERLAKKGRMTDRNVRNCLNGLEAMDELSIVHGRGRGHSNHYQINISLLLSRAKDGNVFQENNTGNVFQEKISRKNATPHPRKEEKSDRKSGSPLPPNHHITIIKEKTKEIPPYTPLQGEPAPGIQKRMRREKLPRSAPDYEPVAYQRFYAAYPKHKAPQEAMNAWDALRPDSALQKVIQDNVEARARADPDWLKDQGAYVPNPATYLRNGRWDDEWKPMAKRIVKFVE